MEPKVLLLDEPCSALDVKASAKIEELLKNLKERYTIVIVTHNLAQAKRIADDVAFFQNGRRVETKDAETFWEKPGVRRDERVFKGMSFIRSVQLFVWWKPDGRCEYGNTGHLLVCRVFHNMGKVGSNQRRIPFHQVNSLGSDDNIQFSGLDHDDLLTGVNHRAFAILSMCFQLKTDNQRLRNKFCRWHRRQQMVTDIGMGL